MKYPDRIPRDAWINSQLSIARHYGGIKINGDFYIVDKNTGDLVKQNQNRKTTPKTRKTKA
jgi:hypothetical protein